MPTVELITPEPAPPPEDKVQITLTQAEASVLMSLLGWTRGGGTLYTQLNHAGIRIDQSLSRRIHDDIGWAKYPTVNL